MGIVVLEAEVGVLEAEVGVLVLILAVGDVVLDPGSVDVSGHGAGQLFIVHNPVELLSSG